MRTRLLLITTVGLLAAANFQDSAREDLKKMEGTWVMTSGEEKGQKLPETVIKDARLMIEGDRHTVKVGKDTLVGTHKVDPSKTPKAIDSSDTEGPHKGKTILGIYKIDGDTFTVCFAPAGKERPKEFSTKSGTGEFLHEWKRAKK